MERLSGRILVLGLGMSGDAAARSLACDMGADGATSITVIDSGDTPMLRGRAEALEQMGVRVLLGATDVEGEYDICVTSPGIPPHAALMKAAVAASTEIISEIEFAFRRSSSPWIAVTGTNGKTTVTSLIDHLLRSAMIPAETVGNIGRPAIQVADMSSPGVALVAEVSSFQLANVDRFHPRVAVLLNITPDHLDWHGSLCAYARDKARMFSRMDKDDTAVIDIDDPGSSVYADEVERSGVRVVRVSRETSHPGGATIRNGRLCINREGGDLELCGVDDLRIRGAHNVSNALAAAAAAIAFGAAPDAVSEALTTFNPIPHRLEPVGEVAGVEYFNDSKATNPDAVLKALTAFSERPVVLMLGGRNKGNRFNAVAEAAAPRCRCVVVFGEAAPEILSGFEGVDVEVRSAASMGEALEEARACAHPGDAVVLSPACASFDEFDSYVQRGDVFRAAVARLAASNTGGASS